MESNITCSNCGNEFEFEVEIGATQLVICPNCGQKFRFVNINADDPHSVGGMFGNSIFGDLFGFDDEQSFEDMLASAEDGDDEAMNDLANIYLNGDDEEDIEPQPEKAFEWSNESAEAGNVTGMFNTALYYAKGFGVKRDLEKAASWMEKAAEYDEDAENLAPILRQASKDLALAESGDSKAQGRLSKFYMSCANMLEQSGTEDFYNEALYWANKGAQENDGQSFCILGLAYAYGRGVVANGKKAKDYYEKGAFAGNTLAIFNLGALYSQGKDVKKNLKLAFELIKIAAENGESQAMAALGQCYQFGWGCMGNMKKAVKWYKKSLEEIYDPELAHKVMVFESIAKDEDYYGEESDRKLTSAEKNLILEISKKLS